MIDAPDAIWREPVRRFQEEIGLPMRDIMEEFLAQELKPRASLRDRLADMVFGGGEVFNG